MALGYLLAGALRAPAGSGGHEMLLLKELVVGLVVILFAAWYYWQAGFLPTHSADPLGAAALPRLLAVAMILFGLAHMVVSYFRCNRLEEDDEPDPLEGAARTWGNLRIVGVILLTGVYMYLVEPLGYTISTCAYLLLLTLLLGARSVSGLALSSIGVTTALVLLFAKFLGVLVPQGFVEQLILH